jgi:hypothetical protein
MRRSDARSTRGADLTLRRGSRPCTAARTAHGRCPAQVRLDRSRRPDSARAG